MDNICAVDGCHSAARGRGWCGRHYYRFRRYNDPNGGGIERHNDWPFDKLFWSRVDKSGGASACWEWMAARHYKGYGETTVGVRKKDKAHRVSWTLERGPIPDGMHVLHRCDNPPCVNPEHLFLGTNADNINDAIAKGRRAVRERHPRTKITQAQADEIRRRYDPGAKMFTTTLAREYGLSSRQVSGIIRFESWA